jgi:Na+/proline symporter
MASHGTDQLIVQRLLACRTQSEGQKALVGSALVVMLQFALFLAVGLLLWSHYEGASMEALGLRRTDEIFPRYIIEGLSPGISGLLIAGIAAAAMSSLSSSLNALASSTKNDLFDRFSSRTLSDAQGLRLSRGFTLFWGAVFIGFASLFQSSNNPVVELGLSIASFTYGGLLGAFFLGLWHRGTRQTEAIVAFIASIVVMVLVIFGVWHHPAQGWLFHFQPPADVIAAQDLRSIGWPWYTLIGTVVNLAVGSALAALRGARSEFGVPSSEKT